MFILVIDVLLFPRINRTLGCFLEYSSDVGLTFPEMLSSGTTKKNFN